MASLRYIIYCRKSTESEDRQIISIESQLTELRRLAEKQNLTVVSVLHESKSAKAPGRPIFSQLLKDIRGGRADGILCWKLDRLARNPIDGGEIIWMLQQRVMKHIQTFDRGYFPDDNVLVLNVEFGMANQFILDLAKNVKRGLRTKAEKGWLPTRAPLGYLNDRTRLKGAAILVKDPERFDLVRRMWEMVLSGAGTSKSIHKMAVDKWGLRNPRGVKPSLSNFYRILTSPFYCGSFEYPIDSGNWYEGAHEPMVTQEQYDRMQIILGRKGKPRPKKHEFPYLGLLSCGECGGGVTAEEKRQVICPACRHKFSSNNKTGCPKCMTPIEAMVKPTFLHYVYYHCTKKKDSACTQKAIERRELEAQIEDRLGRLQLSEGIRRWAMKCLTQADAKDEEVRGEARASQQRTLDQCRKRLDNLFELKISPHNVDGSLLSDEDYSRRKSTLVAEQRRLEQALKGIGGMTDVGAVAGELFDVAANACYWFRNGGPEEKTVILRAVGSNLVLRDKKLIFDLKKPFEMIQKMAEALPGSASTIEPANGGPEQSDFESLQDHNPIRSRQLEDVRTWCLGNRGPIMPKNTREQLQAA